MQNSSGALNTIQDITTTSNVQFAKVAIGTTTLPTPLYVDATFTLSDYTQYGYLNSNGAGTGSSFSAPIGIYCSTRIFAAVEFDTTSDRRVKTDIKEIDDGLAEKFVSRVKPVTFKRRVEGKDGPTHYGYIAQDVIKNFGDICSIDLCHEKVEETIDDDGFVSPADHIFSLKYNQIIPLLHKVILRQEKEIKDLRAQLAIINLKLGI